MPKPFSSSSITKEPHKLSVGLGLISGCLNAKASKRKKRLWRSFQTIVGMFGLFLIIDWLFPAPTTIEYAPIVYAQNQEPLYAFLTKDQQWRMSTDLKEITPTLSQAIVFKEDKYFYYHPGLNPVAVMRAFVNNLVKQKRTSGASTITMQVARLLEPKKRTYFNKLIEIFRAFQLEWHYSKQEILQLYLNLVPYGSNIQGVKAASLLYFNKSPDQLSLAEITALSIIPNRPNSLVIGAHNERLMEARNYWLTKFKASKLFSDILIDDALEEALTATRQPAPQLAPQFAWRVRKMYPSALSIPTTLNAKMQQKVEELSFQYTQSLKLSDINNLSVIVVENATKKVLAYVGSSDFSDTKHHGQVDGVKAVRSPGSTLKPLLYGLAFDKGLATPKTVIADIPIAFKGYAPENYDLDFRGNVTIETALRQSLNIPAVKVLQDLGVANFVNSLHDAGFDAIWKDRQKMGLSMILGGCGVRLEDLAALYTTFASKGAYFPLRFVQEQMHPLMPMDSGVKILSPEANYMVTQVLKELQRPDFPTGQIAAVNIPKIAWKTGTSYGRRDAWSVGYNGRYTIAVWIGNFSGKGAPSLNGAGTATPLLFQLFTALDPNADNAFADVPLGLQARWVCSYTGLVPNTFCVEKVFDTYLPGISDNAMCNHLKEVPITIDELFSYCTSCMPLSGYKKKWYPNIDANLADFYRSRQIDFVAMPEHHPECTRNFGGAAPIINSLNDGATYWITDRGKQSIVLTCAAATDVKKVYWYINDKFIQQADKSEKVVFTPETPVVKISCTDDKGRNANITVYMKYI